MRRISLFTVLFALALGLAGCGGGGNSGSGGSGAAKVSISWPDRTRIISDNVNFVCIYVRLRNVTTNTLEEIPGHEAVRKEIRPPLPAQTVTNLDFVDLPEPSAEKHVVFFARSFNADPTITLNAGLHPTFSTTEYGAGEAVVPIVSGETRSFTITLASAIANLSFALGSGGSILVPDGATGNYTLPMGTTETLTVTGQNSAAQLVLINNNKVNK
jgi:hypothetical protein